MKTILAALTASAAAGLQLAAGPWAQWRGPEFNGSAPSERPPRTFSTSSNVWWVAPMPGPAAATPAIWDHHVLVASTDTTNQTLVALCLDAATGNVRWRQEIAPGTRRDDRSDFASPSPITDGKHAWFYFSTGDLVCFQLDGSKVWHRNIQKDYGEFAFLWTFSSSPLLFDGRLYLQVLQRDVPVSGRGRKDGPIESYLLALDPGTGNELWRQVRPSEARQESREAFSSPIPLRDVSRAEILIAGGDCLTGHNPANGAELWRWGTWNPSRIPHWRLVPSPVSAAGIVLACAPKGGPVCAIRTGATNSLPPDGTAWRSSDREVSADVPTPLCLGNLFYVLNGTRHTLSCVEPQNGTIRWTGSLESTAVFDASPTAADGRIYCLNQRGRLFVVDANPASFRLIDTVDFGREDDTRVRSSVSIADHRLYIRTDSRLFCVGSKPDPASP